MKRISLAHVSTTLIMMLPLLALGTEPQTPESIYAETNTTGGVIVHLGCNEPLFVAALRAGPRYLVMALDRDRRAVERCRRQLAVEGTLGTVTAATLVGDRLPFRDDSVNLIVAPRTLGIRLGEMERVLAPGGAVWLKRGDAWRAVRREKSDDVDDWTHFLYDSTNNAVSRDRRAGPASALQWVDGPRWTRSHDFLSSFAVAVSDNGRLFSIQDEAPVASVMIPPRWTLVCRDALNGVVQWKRKLNDWFDHLHPMRSGPNHLLRRLVAADGKVFVTLGLCSRVSILDAVTGQTIRELPETEHTEEILYRDGCLYLVLNPDVDADSARYYRAHSVRAPAPAVPATRKTIVAADVRTGETLWRKSDEDTSPVMELTLAADDARVYYATDRALVCLDRGVGSEVWKADVSLELHRPTWSVPTLAVYRDVVLFGDRVRQSKREDADAERTLHLNSGGAAAEVTAFAASDGRRLWTCGTRDGFHFPVELFVANDRVWTGSVAYQADPGFVEARDYLTGEVVFERKPDSAYRKFAAGHHRCHRNKATERFLVTGRSFVEWVDLATGELIPNIFLRGTCSFGLLPANGLLYVPPNPCMCATERKMTGFCALAGEPASGVAFHASEARLEKGPAYGQIVNRQATNESPDDWPTYRQNGPRSGVTTMKLQTPLDMRWRQQLPGGRLTSPTAAGGRIIVGSVDAHTISCLDARSGRQLWQFFAGGRVDTPPTIHRGRALFGGRDGCLYAVDLESGDLAWQLHLDPDAPHIHAFGQLESTQPLHGSVLVHGEFLYVVSGRSAFLDGGLHFFKIRADDGEIVETRRLVGKLQGAGGQQDARLPDLLTGAADGFYMRHTKFSYDDFGDVRKVGDHLWSPTGFLDDAWLHRTYWLYGPHFGRSLTLQTPRMPVPAGRLLCVDEKSGIVFGLGRNKYEWGVRPDRWLSGEKHYQVHATPIAPPTDAENEPNVRRGTSLPRTPLWSVRAEIEARAMAVTGDYVLIAGPKGKTVFSETALRGGDGVFLQVLDRTNGTVVQEIPLDAVPTFDGLIAALGNVYVSLQDGCIICLGPPS